MSDFFERLDKYMEYKGLNDNKLTVEAGISVGLIGKGRKRGGLSQENIAKILYNYPDLNANWLFRGEGNMIIEDQIFSSSEVNWKKIIKSQEDLLEILKKQTAK
ncbi:hypothetical protein EG347_11600 [Chryseobacterium sp. G0186]|uniref:hypothetical protein n=1 Tax=Chryseobacterium sp. G0186 TaxID=2487064 RepID=UPI000F4FA785|nr:hypothetical protein [Chryseobacterium sp. G0186]AZA78111.1 hypothetical protein EG347_11600 [Chryseobacterium sp. G0186]